MKTEWQLLCVALGGAVGAVSRFGIGLLIQRMVDHPFPLGTLLANVCGCFLIGLLLGSGLAERSPTSRVGLGVGFLGGLTTFSTFGAETIQHVEHQQWGWAFCNVIANVALGLLAVSLGMLIARKFAA